MKLRNKSTQKEKNKPMKREDINSMKTNTNKEKEISETNDSKNSNIVDNHSNTRKADKSPNNEVREMMISKAIALMNEANNNDETNNKEDVNKDSKISERKIVSFTKKDNSSKQVQEDSYIINFHKNHRSRLKKQYRDNGGNVLTEIQILELLLFYAIPQKDTNPIAHRLIDKFGSVKNVLSADINTLMTVSGIKENSATLISLVNSMFRYIMTPATGVVLDSVTASMNYCRDLFTGVDVEQFYVICLAKSSIIKSVRLIQSGTSDEIAIQLRSITEFALESKCNRIIVAHNHPYGKAIMSDEDCSFTFSLICSCLLNSIDVLDHIIVSPDDTCSIAQELIIKRLKDKAIRSLNIPTPILRLISSNEEEYKLI